MNPSPYGPPPPYGALPPTPYPVHPPGYYAPGPFSPPPPPRRSQTLAIASVIFAFVFAPLGAVLGHLSLRQIRRGLQRGRDIALVGLTLSYTFVVLSVVGVAVWAATAGSPGDVMVADRPDGFMLADPGHPEQPAPPDLSGVLLSREELRQLLNAPGLDEKAPSANSGGDAKAEPAECATAVAAGLNTVYDQSGATGYLRSGYSDTTTATMVDQVAASFPTAAAARSFVAANAAVWQGCAGKPFTITSSSSSGLTWDLGTATLVGDRVSLQNTLKARQDLPQYRILAAKGNVVIDLSVLAKKLDGEPAQIADRMLARVPR